MLCVLHGFAAYLLIADELVLVSVLAALRDWASEAVRLAGQLLCHHAGCCVLLRCVLHCCMVRILLCAAGGAAELAALLWRC